MRSLCAVKRFSYVKDLSHRTHDGSGAPCLIVERIRRSLGPGSIARHRGSSGNRAERAAHRRRPHEPDLVNASEGRLPMPESRPTSQKVYLQGSRPDIRVPMREIALSGGNPPLRLYDTSGLYTDPSADLDLKRGLPPLRLAWILGRGDVQELPGPSSAYRRSREEDPALGGVRFASVRRPLRANPGRCVSQMHYAR